MSVFIGSVPSNNSPYEQKAADVWCSLGGVEVTIMDRAAFSDAVLELRRTFDPIAARNLAALLVRASEECERMREHKERK